MTSTTFKASDCVIAVSTAVLGHVLLFLAFVVLTVMRLASPPPPETSEVQPEVMVEIHPAMFERVVPEPDPIAGRNKHVRTLATQEATEEARNTKLIGEHNTKASGDAKPDPSAPDGPALAGVEPRHPDEINTFDSSFQEGEEPTAQPQDPVAESAPPGEDSPSEPTEVLTQEPTPDPVTEPLPPVAPVEELLQTENRVSVPVLDGPGEERREETLPREKPAEKDPASVQQPGGERKVAEDRKVKASDEDPGFRGEVRKTRVRGAIGQNGPASAEVKNTPLGRYHALLQRAVEREWQQNCIRYRDHITPGILTIRFLVNGQGKVNSFRFLESTKAGEIQKGFTLKAIKNAPIPKMPPVLVKELEGEPLELIYTFYTN